MDDIRDREAKKHAVHRKSNLRAVETSVPQHPPRNN
jgi:hypothetical protein